MPEDKRPSLFDQDAEDDFRYPPGQPQSGRPQGPAQPGRRRRVSPPLGNSDGASQNGYGQPPYQGDAYGGQPPAPYNPPGAPPAGQPSVWDLAGEQPGAGGAQPPYPTPYGNAYDPYARQEYPRQDYPQQDYPRQDYPQQSYPQQGPAPQEDAGQGGAVWGQPYGSQPPPAQTPYKGNRGRRQAVKRGKADKQETPPPGQPSVWDLADSPGGGAGSPPQPPHQPSVWEMADGPQDLQPPEEPAPKKRRKEKKPKQKRERKPLPKGKKLVVRIVGWLAAFALVVCAVVAIALVVFLANSTKNDYLWLDLDQIPYKTETILYYTDQQTGELLEYTRLPSTQNKEYVESDRIPQDLRNAFVAVEDQNFYTHGGFSFKRTVYAALNEVKYMITGSYIGGESGRKQGASTIDQQLVKNLTRDDEDSNMAGYLRKVREIYRAWKMDGEYEKEVILDAYLNTISFTGNTAGVGTEAKKLFGKEVQELNLAECASLAAITRNPARYNPVKNPEEHLNRRDYVLSLMLEQGYIDQAQHDAALATPLETDYQGEPARENQVTSYFTDVVIDEVITLFSEEYGITRKEATHLLYNGGLRVHTTVVPALQSAMEQVMEEARFYPRPAITVRGPLVDEEGQPVLDEAGNQVFGDVEEQPQAAMITLGYAGDICGVVGGLGEKEISRGFNRGTSAVRQVGSTMKPISPYICALEADEITWSTGFLDAPVRQIEDENTGEMVDWPSNVDNNYSGRNILVREAFARSVNTIAVRVGETVGDRAMYNFVHGELDISTFVRDDAKPGPLVLGSSTYGITPLDMTKAYAIFGNGGSLPNPHSFTQVTAGTGDVLMSRDVSMEQIIGEDSSFIVNRLMREVVTGDGTASGMSVPGEMDSVGKTGTTSDNRDHWFIGLTPYYVTASWYGYDSNMPLSVDNSNHPPTLAWRSVMQQAQQSLPYKDFPTTGLVRQDSYCTSTGYAAGPNCPAATGWYKLDVPPTPGCPEHG